MKKSKKKAGYLNIFPIFLCLLFVIRDEYYDIEKIRNFQIKNIFIYKEKKMTQMTVNFYIKMYVRNINFM